MKMTLRWIPQEGGIPLEHVRQVPCLTGVVSEVVKPVGEVWTPEEIGALKRRVEAAGLELEVIESVKVHEDIKLGLPTRERYIEAYAQTLRNLGRAGVRCVCYDFMPVFDWMRTQTDKKMADGSLTLAYSVEQMKALDPLSGSFALCDWELGFPPEEIGQYVEGFRALGEEGLWRNLEYFLSKIIPVAQESGVRMAMHPDDPCWPVFGLPRIIRDEACIDRLLSIVDSPYNALTLCSGSLGCSDKNDVPALVYRYAKRDRVAFGHVRNVKRYADGSFEETSHLAACGSLDTVEIMRAYHEANFKGYIRPDHGRTIWGEQCGAGYGLYDRALGAMYLSGIWDALEKKAGR